MKNQNLIMKKQRFDNRSRFLTTLNIIKIKSIRIIVIIVHEIKIQNMETIKNSYFFFVIV